jgi:hypothetical protein
MLDAHGGGDGRGAHAAWVPPCITTPSGTDPLAWQLPDGHAEGCGRAVNRSDPADPSAAVARATAVAAVEVGAARAL